MFLPVALGFFGLGTGYLIYGPHELFGFPRRDPQVDRAIGMWGIWLPGFCQALVGVILFVGLTWFQVFIDVRATYMAALAFSAYGIHWFVLGWNRAHGADPRPNGFMAIPYIILSVLGATVFFLADGWPLGVFCTAASLSSSNRIACNCFGESRLKGRPASAYASSVISCMRLASSEL